MIDGSRIVLIVGTTCAAFIAIIGTNVGLIAGYYGGRVDAALMRITGLAFGIPFIPFAVVLVALLGPSLWNMILTISLLMWRTTARVIRSQVLSLRERAFVKAARIAGASDFRIIYVHIFPNVLPMTLLYVAFDIAWAVLAEASISFLGFGDPNQVSWGQMLYLAYVSGSIRQAWWWTIPPGLALSLFVISVFWSVASTRSSRARGSFDHAPDRARRRFDRLSHAGRCGVCGQRRFPRARSGNCIGPRGRVWLRQVHARAGDPWSAATLCQRL